VAQQDDLVAVVGQTADDVLDGSDVLGEARQRQLGAADAGQGDVVGLVSRAREHGAELIPDRGQLPRARDDDDGGEVGVVVGGHGGGDDGGCGQGEKAEWEGEHGVVASG